MRIHISWIAEHSQILAADRVVELVNKGDFWTSRPSAPGGGGTHPENDAGAPPSCSDPYWCGCQKA